MEQLGSRRTSYGATLARQRFIDDLGALVRRGRGRGRDACTDREAALIPCCDAFSSVVGTRCVGYCDGL